ncbi:MAG: hypothetical protein RLZZ458_39, partial [Planctomycetota bacterium]
GIPGTSDGCERPQIGRESGWKQGDGVCLFPCGKELFKLLLLGRAADDEWAGSGARLLRGCFGEGVEDFGVEAEAEIVIGSKAKAVATVGDALHGAGANGDGPGSALRGGGECLQGRGQALLEAGAGHGGRYGCSGTEAGQGTSQKKARTMSCGRKRRERDSNPRNPFLSSHH